MRVLLPGSYDPVTNGHLAIIEAAAKKYDEVFAVVFVNPEKTYTYSVDDRVKMLILATDHLENVIVSYSAGLVVDYMREHEIDKIVKGYRNELDYEYELMQAQFNYSHGGYETELIKCEAGMEYISSTAAREKIASGERLDGILPRPVIEFIKNR